MIDSGPAPPLHIVLVEPEIAANVGAIGRTCVALSAKLWLVRPFGFRMDDRHLRRAGLDYWDHLKWECLDHLDELTCAKNPSCLWSLTTRGRRHYDQVQYNFGDMLIFGSEGRGLPQSWVDEQGDQTIRIPMASQARCLNLACSVAVAGFEAARQIRLQCDGYEMR